MNTLFVWRTWMRTLTTWLCVTALIVGIARIYNGEASAWWLVATFVVNQVFMFTLSVGNHRLFSHAAFKTSRFWHCFFAIISVVSGNGSAYTWNFIHQGHHRHSDTDLDPYEVSWHYFFRYKHKAIKFDVSKTKWVLRDPLHMITHRYALLIVLATAVLAYSVSLNTLLFAYAIPMLYHHLTGGLLIIFTHDNKVPCDRPWWFGIFLPSAGEWYHRAHHEEAGARRLNNAQLPGQFDTGCWFAKLISTKC